jgi:23S rRNA pseudouridine2605 synthase
MSDDQAEAAVREVRAGQRIAKVMARAGVCSRRDAEAWIAEGRVSVNGVTLLSPAFNVSETDDVRVDGKPLAKPERTRLFLFHKPRGLVTTARDPEGRPTVFDTLPQGLPRLVAVGRLDINTEGLLLLTNDGGLARVLELPSTGWLRRYRVRAHGTIGQAALDRLAGGVAIDGVDYQGVEARLDREQGANSWLTLGLREGKNREIKKILEHLGLAVNRLIRVSFGPFELGDLSEGEVVEVRTRVLRDQLGVKLAKEAGANFDLPLIVRDAPAPEPGPGERPQGERGRENPAVQRRSDRGVGGAGRAERDRAPRQALPKSSTPDRRRKHVSVLRSEIAAHASNAKGPRMRVERGSTQDRKGRTVAIERRSRAHDAESGRPGREPPERGRRPTRFDSKAARDGKGRGRIGAPERSGTAPGGAFKPGAERDGGPKGRKSADGKSERSGPRDQPRRFKPRKGSARSPGAERRDGRNGPWPGENRATRTKPPRTGPGRGKGPPSGPRRPPRKR